MTHASQGRQRCDRCGTYLDRGGRFCSSCGYGIDAAGDWSRPKDVGLQAEIERRDSHGVAARGAHFRKLLLATVLVAAGVGLAGGTYALVTEVGSSRGGMSAGDPPPGAQPPAPPETDDQDSESEGVPKGNSSRGLDLAEAIPRRIGEYRLVEGSLVPDPAALAEGAEAAFSAVYERSDGATVRHWVQVRAEGDAGRYVTDVARRIETIQGWVPRASGDVKDSSGEVVGRFFVLQSGTDVQAVTLEQAVVWSSRDLTAMLTAPVPQAWDVYSIFPY